MSNSYLTPPTYYKYTTGEAFTLDGEDYVGPFHIFGDTAYTGIKADGNEEKLTPKNTFISDLFMGKYEMDHIFGNSPKLAKNYSNLFDILNKEQLTTMLDSLHVNNVLVYKSLIGYNPDVLSFNDNFHFYGLSSTEADMRNDDVPSGKNVYTHIDPFSNDSEWSFLDDEVISSDFTVSSDESFVYNLTNTSGNYQIAGSFVLKTPITVQNIDSSVSYSHLDVIENKYYVVEGDAIKIYDYKSYSTCGTENLIDQITLQDDVVSVRFGDAYRLEIGNDFFHVMEKEGTEIIKTYLFSDLNITNLLDIQIRSVDDYILILHSDSEEKIYLTQLYDDLFSTNIIEGISLTDKMKISFSMSDSNLFFLSSSEDLQSRLISYPKYPVGKINTGSLLYLRDYLYNTTYERFSKIQIKWNSNSMKSNYFNPLSITTNTVNNQLYLILHTIGRIYVSKQSPSSLYSENISLGLDKEYSSLMCSENSIGIQLNVELYKIIRDLLNLYTLANKKSIYTETERIDEIIEDLNVDVANLYLHTNETINVISLQRILDNILQIQTQLISE